MSYNYIKALLSGTIQKYFHYKLKSGHFIILIGMLCDFIWQCENTVIHRKKEKNISKKKIIWVSDNAACIDWLNNSDVLPSQGSRGMSSELIILLQNNVFYCHALEDKFLFNKSLHDWSPWHIDSSEFQRVHLLSGCAPLEGCLSSDEMLQKHNPQPGQRRQRCYQDFTLSHSHASGVWNTGPIFYKAWQRCVLRAKSLSRVWLLQPHGR